MAYASPDSTPSPTHTHADSSFQSCVGRRVLGARKQAKTAAYTLTPTRQYRIRYTPYWQNISKNALMDAAYNNWLARINPFPHSVRRRVRCVRGA